MKEDNQKENTHVWLHTSGASARLKPLDCGMLLLLGTFTEMAMGRDRLWS